MGTPVNPLKQQGKISSNSELHTGIPEMHLSVTRAVATIPFRADSRPIRDSANSDTGVLQFAVIRRENGETQKREWGTTKRGETTRLPARIWHHRLKPLRLFRSWISGYRQNGCSRFYGTSRAAPASNGSGRKPNEGCCRTFGGGDSSFTGRARSWNGLASANVGRTA